MWRIGVLVGVDHWFEYTPRLDVCDNESMTVRTILMIDEVHRGVALELVH